VPDLRWSGSTALLGAGRTIRWRWPVVGLDFLATPARVKLGLVAVPLFAKLHEHGQFFTERSLTQLAQHAGLVGLESGSSSGMILWKQTSAIGLIGTPEESVS